ncbi:urea carboxylase [Lipingzhangella halophila]|uniref:Urea carboxylase n=1 Tax=Lipingzhangella halophila TaxID=1783352 RepID=A0A7W7RDI3_9ACTN|nr:biotin-dependent carboxyltransferase family protein [Lipingzhangella halophila]MBB4929648.1 urea carboxylase [Lipingzhangella halophila]
MSTGANGDAGGPIALEVVDPGVQTTVQEYPGRTGLQRWGLFPAGPVDHLAFRLANVLTGNPEGAAALEIPAGRFTARVSRPGLVALCGAEGAAPTLNGEALPMWEAVPVAPGDLLATRTARGPGFRLYLAVSGGIEVPPMLGSRATHTVGHIGGLAGRPLVRGDLLEGAGAPGTAPAPLRVPQSLRPAYPRHWEIEVMRGPHSTPELFTADAWAELVSSTLRVSLNSDRLATQLNPHRFDWPRADGGVAGSHPSNILDASFPLGGIVINGDVPMIVGPDGPTSGGFTVVATVAHAALWRVGQLRPGHDTVRFREIDLEEAIALSAHVEYPLDPGHLERVG